MPWRVVSGPIRCAESACGLHLSMRLPVVEVQAKSVESEKFRQLLFSPLYQHFQLESERFGEFFLDLFDALNPPVASICPCDCQLLRYRQNWAQFLRVKNFGSIYSSSPTSTFN